jgi:hypothetical protein
MPLLRRLPDNEYIRDGEVWILWNLVQKRNPLASLVGRCNYAICWSLAILPDSIT